MTSEWQELYDADTDTTTYLNVTTGEKMSAHEFKVFAENNKTEVVREQPVTSPPPAQQQKDETPAVTTPPMEEKKTPPTHDDTPHHHNRMSEKAEHVAENVGNAIKAAEHTVTGTASWYWYAPWMEKFESWLVFFSVAFAAVSIACIEQMFTVAPYSQMAEAFAFFSIGYVIISSGAVAMWVYLYKERKARVGTRWFKDFTIHSWKFWLYLLGLVAFVICTILMISVIFMETFYPTYATMKLSRIGGVTQTTASFFIRDPTTSNPVYIEFRKSNVDVLFNRTEGRILNDTYDFTTWFLVEGLEPNTTYDWRINGQSSPPWYSFNTLLSPGTPAAFTFYFGSCYIPFLPSFTNSPGFSYLRDLKPDLIFYIGDFVYGDVPYKMGDDLTSYRNLYRQAFRNPYTIQALVNTPNYQMWDDHETTNDQVFPNGDTSTERYQNGIANSWQVYMGAGNPRTKPYPKFYYWFNQGDTAFFVMDTRGNRSHSTLQLEALNIPVDANDTWIISEEQEADFKNWLLATKDTSVFRLVMSPIEMTAELEGHIVDSWGGFLTQRNRIFQFIQDNNITGTVFYTGDYHAAYAVELLKNGSQLYEFSASPISAFDFTLGGYAPYSSDMWKEINVRKERVLFTDIGQVGGISLLGRVKVNTTASPPYIVNEIYRDENLVFSKTLTINDLMPGNHK